MRGTNPLDPLSVPGPISTARQAKSAGKFISKNDSDGDGLTDSFETQRGYDPNSADSDGDGIADGLELLHDLNPLEINSAADVQPDSDGDGISDSVESKLGTDPNDADSDRDLLSDPYEILFGQDPTHPDTNRNGILDGREDNFDGSLFGPKRLVIDFSDAN